ncbi:MAG: PorP/SprF family type IX secretion system membrane protein [Cyclobacteriaceae bacterium]
MKRFSLGILLFFLSNNLLAQEQRVFSQFFMNPYVYNPAYVGVEGHTALFVAYRAQYTGLTGGPSFSHANIHTPLKGGIGIGGMLFNELEGGILSTSGFKVSSSYLVPFDKKHYLRFGMSLGAGTTSLDDSDPAIAADIFGDPAFSNLSNKYLIADFGMSYHFDHFNVGLSIPNLISREVISSESFSPIRVSPLDNLLIKMNYRGHISHDFAIEPHLLYRYSSITTSQYEAAVIAHLKHIVWVGASFRQGAGINALVGFKVKEKLGVGYAFELGNSNISSIIGTTHEIHLGYHLSEHKKHHGHHHSFIKSHKLTAEERAKLAEEKKRKQEEKAKRDEERQAKLNEKTTEPTEEYNTIEKVEEVEVDDSSTSTTEERSDPSSESSTTDDRRDNETRPEETDSSQRRDTQQSRDTEQSRDNTSDNNTEDNTRIINTPPVITSEEVVAPDNAHRVKRGTHFLELPPGNHVIAGAFSEFQHAEDFSDELFQRGFHDTIVGYQSQKGYYYVVLFRSADHAAAAAQRSRIRRMKGMEEVWILVVQ